MTTLPGKPLALDANAGVSDVRADFCVAGWRADPHNPAIKWFFDR